MGPDRGVTRRAPTALAARLAAALAFAAAARAAAAPAFPPRTPDNLPNVQSASAIVVDLDTGDVLYEKNADEVRPIASTGKVFVALLVRQRHIDLDAETEITAVDRDLSRGGARTHLPVGYAFRNLDLLRAMLIASDNRAPSALGRAVGLDPPQLVAALTAYARDLGLRHTEFTDPPGLRGNVSTAREMVTALRAALADDVIAGILRTPHVEIASTRPRRRTIRYRNTNRSLISRRYRVLGGKTGYTDAAGYCLIIAAEIGGRRVAMALLGSAGKLTRYGDFNRIAGWIEDGMPNASRAVAGTR